MNTEVEKMKIRIQFERAVQELFYDIINQAYKSGFNSAWEIYKELYSETEKATAQGE